MKKYKTVYIDMDGVIADWVSGFKNKTGLHPDQFQGRIDMIKSQFPENDFYYNLPAYPWIKDLIEKAKEIGDEVKILTACGKFKPEKVAEQKKRWLEKNGIDLDMIWVKRSKQKAKYADEESVLIDDREKALDPWIKAGGKGIKFVEKGDGYELEEYKG